jgi:DNA-binding CsgD family transcriptional regulator
LLIDEEDYFQHYGTPRRSGRYPWGSGGEEGSSPRNKSLLDTVAEMQRENMTEAEIARGLGMSTTQLRAEKSIEKNRLKQDRINTAQRYKDAGWSNTAIGERMGLNESTVRSLLEPGAKDKADVLQSTADMLKDQVEKKGLIDIGTGVESHIGVSSTKLSTAVAILEAEGYGVHYVKVQQLGTGKETTIKVLSKPGMSYRDVYANRSEIKQVTDYSEDGGRSYLGLKPPLSISSKRIGINYAEDGGSDADGVIYVRPGKADVSLGGARYAQVRIAVDGTHYLKGMAMYKDDLPDGVDLVFNTNKSSTGNKVDAMKAMKDDPDNPFGAIVHQRIDKDGKVISAMNIVNEEGDWEKWSRSLSSQMLSKQTPALAKRQLDLALKTKQDEFAEIMALTNPAVKAKLLESFGDDADAASVHLKAAAIPRQRGQVILPVVSLSDREIYAPNFRDGERVALVRYPHGGIFEIPELTVNNKHPESKKLLGAAADAVGINPKVAARLSGADFDGDTVLVIPNNNRQVRTAPALEGLKGFDPQRAYPAYEGMKPMNARTKQLQMGDVSNLITDMTIKGATPGELARAVRHSMVVIDAEKHRLNWKQSAKDNGIAALKTKYQGGPRAGSATLISRAGSDVRVLERKGRSAGKGGPIDRDTGKRAYEETGASYVGRDGTTIIKTTKSKRLAETDDANTLSSGTTIEKVYVDYSNNLKSLANKARLEGLAVKPLPYSPSAKKVYAAEVTTLNAKLNIALRNRPLERQAQVVANAIVATKRQANPHMDPAELKKLKGQALTEARLRTGAKKERVVITDSEWAAIQAGAISNNKLVAILANADLDRVKQLATPKSTVLVTPSKLARAEAMLSSGYTQAEVADALGVGLTTLKTSLGGGG